MNAYEVLGLQPGASKAQVKQAYRKFANLYHPDRNSDPGAIDKFKLAKEAYEFITKGTSSTKAFTKVTKVVPPKKKKEQTENTVWATGYGATNVRAALLLVSFQDAFTGAKLPIYQTPFYVNVPKGVQHGYRERKLCATRENQQAYFDVEYRLYDPSGFYKIQELEGATRFCCHLEVTPAQLLSETEFSLKNVDPSRGPIIMKVPMDYQKFVRIPNAGIRLGQGLRRSDLYVIPVMKMTPIDKEIYPVLKQLESKVRDALKVYNYFK